MPEKTALYCDQIPPAFGHYSQAVKYENSIYVSALYPTDTQTKKLVSDDPGEQSKKMYENLAALLQYAGAQLSNIVMMRIYMTHFEDLKALEKVSKEVFFFVPPARTIVPVPWLPYGARMAVDAYVEIVPAQAQKGMLF
jgi:enamine deaminase RidA (YjgF/YER057c/UK114 family)